MESFVPVAILLIYALVVCGAVFATTLIGPRVFPNAKKLTVYECGVSPEGSARSPFKMHFYLIAVLFLLFDVEAAFFFPWALVYRESLQSSAALLVALLVYMGILVLGLVYVYRKDALRLK